MHVIISGRVQGVCYRYWTQQNAKKFGLTGWVRNRHDGSVEAEFCGEKAQVDEMMRMCRTGPGGLLSRIPKSTFFLNLLNIQGFLFCRHGNKPVAALRVSR